MNTHRCSGVQDAHGELVSHPDRFLKMAAATIQSRKPSPYSWCSDIRVSFYGHMLKLQAP